LDFEWDPLKAGSNLVMHGLSFEEAATAFGDPLGASYDDPDHSDSEERYLLLESTEGGRVVVVSFTERVDTVRIISARFATRRERRVYEHG
jgi:uncharacterized DUF497 family protein